MKINIDAGGTPKGDTAAGGEILTPWEESNNRCISDLLSIYHNKKMYINEKGYMQKLIELLYNMGYYIDNKSIFLDKE